MNEKLKYKLVFFIRYLGDAFFFPFFSLFLSSIGLVESRIGFLLSISPLLAVILNPVYSRIVANNQKRIKNTLGIISILEGIFIFLISINTNFIVLTVLVILMAIFGSCHYGLMDSVGQLFADEEKITFSSMRVFGSISYVIGTTLAGYMVKYLNYQMTFFVCMLTFIISGIIYISLKNIEVENNENVKKNKSYIGLLKNGKLMFTVLFLALMTCVMYTTNNFFPNYLYSRGMSEDQYGLFYSLFVSIEVISLFVLNKIKKKINIHFLFVIAAICLFIRTFICYLYLPMVWIVILSCLRGINFAIFLHCGFYYINNLVGKSEAANGIMLYTLIHSIGLVILNNVNGNIIEISSFKMYYLFMSILSVVVLILSLIRYVIFKNEEERFIGE